MSGLIDAVRRQFSQTRWVRSRRANGLHPVDEMKRFSLLVCCFFCSLCVSIVYAFDLFTDDFQQMFQLSDGDLSTISTVGLVFCYFTIPYSAIFESMGPFLLFWICCLAALIGGLGLILVLNGKIVGNTATLAVFYAFLNVCSGLIDTAYISTMFEFFPRNRGPVVCLAKVMTGLGASVLACVNAMFFMNSITSFIAFLMAICMFVSAWASYSITLPPYFMNWWRRRNKTPQEIAELEVLVCEYKHKFVPKRRLVIGYVIVIALIIFFVIESLVVQYTEVSQTSKYVIGALAVFLVLSIFLILLPIRCLGGMDERYNWDNIDALLAVEATSMKARGNVLLTKNANRDSEPLKVSPATGSVVPASNDENVLDDALVDAAGDPTAMHDGEHVEHDQLAELVVSRQDPRYDGSLKNYLLGLDLWLIMLLFVCYGCMGILVMYNASSIYVSVSGNSRDKSLSTIYTTFLGVGSSVGRIAFGLFEAYVQHQDPMHRRILVTHALPLSPLMATIAGVLILVLPAKALLFPFLLVYLEEGVFAGVNALIFPCLFERNHNALYNLSFLVQCITTICFNRLLFGMYVDMQHDKLNLPKNQSCSDKRCTRVPLIVATCLAFVGIFVATAIHVRYRRFVTRARKEMALKTSTSSNECDGS